MITRRAALALAAVVALAGCSDGDSAPRATVSVPVPTLPAGELSPRVLQPGDVSRNLVPIAAQTGTRDLKAIAAFSADPPKAEKSLQEHGFQSAYVVQYADPQNAAVVTNVVTKFATAAGATADLAADLTASGATGETFSVTGLGEQAGGVRGRLEPSLPVGTLITLRWRVGDTTWLLAVGSKKQVDEGSVRRLADKLTGR
ncbi:MAG TPA: hypothetical protein VGX28_07575 [Frankiaceae bacterium]|nr:hypothetical protein [Frankiaceae bacterium]